MKKELYYEKGILLMSGMHLVRGMSSINNKKRKVNRKPGHAAAQARHEKWLMDRGVHPDQLKGKVKDSGNKIPNYAEGRATIPTSNSIIGDCTKKQSQRYTGTFVKGVAQMHKSNAVPITSSKDAKEVARMRRG